MAKYTVVLNSCGDNKERVVEFIASVVGVNVDAVLEIVNSLPCKLCVSDNYEKIQKLVDAIKSVGGDACVDNPNEVQASIECGDTQNDETNEAKPTIRKVSHIISGSNSIKKHSIWSVLSGCSLICSFFTLYKGIDKMTNYYNSENFPSLNVNAYVGGDAYNYIINGTYATAFFVLTAMFVMSAIGLMVLHYISRNNLHLQSQNAKSNIIDDVDPENTQNTIQ